MPPKISKTRKRKMMTDGYNYCELLGALEIPKRVPSNWCMCAACPSGKILPQNAVCCATIRKTKTELARNWLTFIGEHDECFATHPKIQNLINNKEDLDSFMIIDGIRKDQLADEGGKD